MKKYKPILTHLTAYLRKDPLHSVSSPPMVTIYHYQVLCPHQLCTTALYSNSRYNQCIMQMRYVCDVCDVYTYNIVYQYVYCIITVPSIGILRHVIINIS